MSKRKVKLYLVADYGGEWEDAWEEHIVAFGNRADAETCAVKRTARQSILSKDFGYSGAIFTDLDAVIDVSIFAPKDVRDE